MFILVDNLYCHCERSGAIAERSVAIPQLRAKNLNTGLRSLSRTRYGIAFSLTVFVRASRNDSVFCRLPYLPSTSLYKLPKTPFTNLPLEFPPNVLASSIASLIATFGGTSFFSSNIIS